MECCKNCSIPIGSGTKLESIILNTRHPDPRICGAHRNPSRHGSFSRQVPEPRQPATLAKYRTLANQLRAYAEARGYVFLDQITVADMDGYASWNDGIRAKAKKLDRLKSFINFCFKRKWLTEDVAEDLQAPAGSSITLPKTPFR